MEEDAVKVGSKVLVALENMEIPMKVLDVRVAFGRRDVLVTPVGGAGERWLSDRKIVTATR